MMPVPSDPSKARRTWIFAGLWVFVAAVIVVFHAVVLPFVGAALIAYLIAPLVQRAQRLHVRGRRVPRWGALLGIYALFFLAVYAFFVLLLPQLYRELARISRDALEWVNSLTPERIQQIALATERWLSEHGIPVALSSRSLEGAEGGGSSAFGLSLDLAQLIRDTATRTSGLLRENLGNIVATSRTIVTSAVAAVFGLFFILMVASFFTIDSERIAAYCRSLVPPEHRGQAAVLVRQIDRSLAGVVRGQMTICLINGSLTFVGLLLLRVKFAFLLATIATLFSLIPIFGTILSSVPIVLIGLSQSWKTGISALAWILGIHALEAYLLNPKIMGSAARIHPVVVAFALIAGEHAFGLIGALLAPPAAAVLVACFDFVRLKAEGPS